VYGDPLKYGGSHGLTKLTKVSMAVNASGPRKLSGLLPEEEDSSRGVTVIIPGGRDGNGVIMIIPGWVGVVI
jgi:hypothetical protein